MAKIKKPLLYPLAATLFLTLVLSGLLDIAHALKKDGESVRILDAKDLEVSQLVRLHTPKDALFLTAGVHNHPLILTGRKILMGYPGTLWTHGISYWKRERDQRALLQGQEGTAALLKRYGITHVLAGPAERNEGFNETFYNEHFQTRLQIGDRLIFEDPR